MCVLVPLERAGSWDVCASSSGESWKLGCVLVTLERAGQ